MSNTETSTASLVETTIPLIVTIVFYIIIDIWFRVTCQPHVLRADIRRIRPRFLNINSECPRCVWGGVAFERKYHALQRRIKATQRLGYICGINGIYVYTVMSSDIRLRPTR